MGGNRSSVQPFIGVLVHERSLEHPCDDLHVAVGMGLEAGAGQHTVVVVHQQQPEVGVVGPVVAAEGEAVLGVEPADVGREPFVGTADVDGGLKGGGTHGDFRGWMRMCRVEHRGDLIHSPSAPSRDHS